MEQRQEVIKVNGAVWNITKRFKDCFLLERYGLTARFILKTGNLIQRHALNGRLIKV